MRRQFLLAMLAVVSVALWVGAVYAGGEAKVDICHRPPGNPENFHTITVAVSALQSHLDHGDLDGDCLEFCQELCGDGNACTIDCAPITGACLSDHPPVDCNDSNACTTDTCHSADGCVNTADVCDDGNDCTADLCTDNAGEAQCNSAVPVVDGQTCDDHNPDTDDDVCAGGVCAGTSGPSCQCWSRSELSAIQPFSDWDLGGYVPYNSAADWCSNTAMCTGANIYPQSFIDENVFPGANPCQFAMFGNLALAYIASDGPHCRYQTATASRSDRISQANYDICVSQIRARFLALGAWSCFQP